MRQPIKTKTAADIAATLVTATNYLLRDENAGYPVLIYPMSFLRSLQSVRLHKLLPKLTARRECLLQGDHFVRPGASFWPI
jgi:hypothetical protein